MKQFYAVCAVAPLAFALPLVVAAQGTPAATVIAGTFYPTAAVPTLAAPAPQAVPKLPSTARTNATWNALASMTTARGQHATVAVNDRLYAWGGYVSIGNTASEVKNLEIYNIATNAWSAGASYPIACRGHAAAAGANGLLYSFSGVSGSSVPNCYQYNPATNAWTAIANIPTKVWEATATTAANGKIYVIGGEANDNAFISQAVQIYDPALNTWTTGANMPTSRRGATAILDANGNIHIIGGSDVGVVATHEVYNPTTNTWTTAAALPFALNQSSGALGSDGKLYVVGGKVNLTNNQGPFYNTVYVYDTGTNTWSTGPSLPIPISENKVVASGGQLYQLGGSNGTQQAGLYALAPGNVYTWTGATSTDWLVGTNWSGGVVPTATDNVSIPAGLTRYPVVSTTATAQDATLNSGAQLTLANGGTLTLTGNFANNGTFTATGDATLALGGSTSQTLGGSATTRLRNLMVGTAGATLVGTTELTRLLTLVGNLATNNQRFVVASTDAGSGMVYNKGGVVTGRTAVQRYIDPATNAGFGYRHFAPSVSGATLDALRMVPVLAGATSPGPLQINPAYNTAAQPSTVTPFPTVFAYDETRITTASFDQGLLSPTVAIQPLTAGQGLIINEPGGNAFEVSGLTLITGALTRGGLTRTNAANGGWQLLGNPYPAPIDWGRVARTNVDAAAYVYRSTGQYTGGYLPYVNGVGTSLLPMGQAFFVRVSSVGSAGAVAFTDAARETTYTSPTYSRTTAETRPLLQLSLQRQGTTGAANQGNLYVYEQAGATVGFDAEFDAYQVQLNSGSQPSIYQQAGTEALAIQGLPAGTTPRDLPLGVNAPVAGTYAFTPTQLLNFPATEPVWLEDKLIGGPWYNLRLGAYTATLTQGLSTTRFVLHLHTTQPLATTAPGAWAGELQLYPNPATDAPVLVVASGVPAASAELVLLNSVGQRVWQRTAAVAGQELRTTVPVAGLARGIYTLQVRSAGGVLTRKLVLR